MELVVMKEKLIHDFRRKNMEKNKENSLNL